MRRGPWHQFGDRSQRLAIEQIENGKGVGVIISPRDLAYRHAIRYAQVYHDLSVQVLLDPQFYVPDFSNRNLISYPTNDIRTIVSQMQPLSEVELARLASAIREVNNEINADGIIAPAVIYQAGRQDIIQMNSRLFRVAKNVGDEIGIPTYASVVMGRSATSSEQTIDAILGPVTSLNADGWYFAFEFEPERIPSSHDAIYRFCVAGLKLAYTGKPVLHAYAGPMALLSFGFGATATGIGHCQNLWRFCVGRWQPRGRNGGRGDAPARYFSKSLWGTIIYPEEFSSLSIDLQSTVLSPSLFSTLVNPGQPFLQFSRWDANKHLVYTICSTVGEISESLDPRTNASAAITLLQNSISLHGTIAGMGLTLRDDTNIYQENWRTALNELLESRASEYDYLELLRS